MIEELLIEKELEYFRVDGSNSRHAGKFSEEFNTNPDKRVWLAQISTGVALTLTGAAYTIYYTLGYGLDAYLQSRDRNYRIGQSHSTFIYRLTCPKSITDIIAAALEQKQDIAKTFTYLF